MLDRFERRELEEPRFEFLPSDLGRVTTSLKRKSTQNQETDDVRARRKTESTHTNLQTNDQSRSQVRSPIEEGQKRSRFPNPLENPESRSEMRRKILSDIREVNDTEEKNFLFAVNWISKISELRLVS
jgi:hypothetical protein